MPIPRRIHQIWLQGESELPEEYQSCVRNWRGMHPEWEYRLWDDEAIRRLLAERHPWFLRTYTAYRYLHQRVDSARCFILYEYGGFYSDVDTEPLKPLDLLLEELPQARLILSEQPFSPVERRLLRPFVGAKRIVTNAVMGSEKGFPAWKPLLELLPKRRRRFAFNRELNITYSTGPALVSGAFDSYIREDPTVVVVPHTYFEAHFGFDPAFEEGSADELQERYVAHMQHATWHSPTLKYLFRKYFLVKKLFQGDRANQATGSDRPGVIDG